MCVLQRFKTKDREVPETGFEVQLAVSGLIAGWLWVKGNLVASGDRE